MVPSLDCLLCGRSPGRRRPASLAPFVAHRTGATTPAGFSLFHCEACDFAWFSHRFEEREVSALYVGYRGEAYTAERRRFEPAYGTTGDGLGDETAETREHRSSLVRTLALRAGSAPNTVLDYGGGRDAWLARQAFPTAQVDLFDLAESAQAPNVTVDFVICANLLEHVSFPLSVLGDIRELLTPNGFLHAEIPLGPSPLERFLALEGPATCHEHVSYFTPRALQVALVHAGFAVAPRLAHHAAIGRKVSGPFVARAHQQLAGTRVERWRGWSEAQRFA